ncbi:hypothetical protein HDU93_003391, partial [Gonapodya sp. JEL0774]
MDAKTREMIRPRDIRITWYQPSWWYSPVITPEVLAVLHHASNDATSWEFDRSNVEDFLTVCDLVQPLAARLKRLCVGVLVGWVAKRLGLSIVNRRLDTLLRDCIALEELQLLCQDGITVSISPKLSMTLRSLALRGGNINSWDHVLGRRFAEIDQLSIGALTQYQLEFVRFMPKLKILDISECGILVTWKAVADVLTAVGDKLHIFSHKID